MSSRTLSKMRTPDDTRSIQLDRQRIVSKFIEKRRDDHDTNCEPYFFFVILDRDQNAYGPEYGLFYRLKPSEPDEDIGYK
ncbi:MAG: hypothetical protein U9O53_01825 [archaeon]|nr:hypothetical protein [archaeon]